MTFIYTNNRKLKSLFVCLKCGARNKIFTMTDGHRPSYCFKSECHLPSWMLYNICSESIKSFKEPINKVNGFYSHFSVKLSLRFKSNYIEIKYFLSFRPPIEGFPVVDVWTFTSRLNYKINWINVIQWLISVIITYTMFFLA